MKRLTIFCLAVLATSFLFSLPGGAMPTHDARFLNLEITYTLNADGSWERDYGHRVRLDTYFAVNRALGETFIVYDPDFQELEVLKSETTMADGRKVASPANAFNEVLPFAAHGFADFSGLREMVVTHVGLERGAVVDLRYRIRTKPGFLAAFAGRELLTRDFPIDSLTMIFVVPRGVTLNHEVFGMKAQLIVDLDPDQGRDRYNFHFKDMAASSHEPLAHPQAEPFIVFSTAADWKQAMPLASDPSRLPESLSARIEKLMAQSPARADMLAALQRLAASEFRNCPLGIEATGWRSRPVERVAAGNYGTRLEKALLLQAMLKKAGIDAELLAVAGDAFAAKVPAATQFSEFWLKAADGPGAAYLDPWREQQGLFPYAVHGLEAWNMERQEMEKLPASGWEQNGIDVSGPVSLGAAGASGTLQVSVRGSFQRYEEAASDSARFITRVLGRFFPVEKVEIKKLLALTRHEIRVEAGFSGKWLKDIGANFYSAASLRLPMVQEGMALPARRESPMLLEAPFQVSLRLDVQPEPGLRLEYARANVKQENKAGYFFRVLEPEKNGRLRISDSCGISRSLIGPEEYSLLRELLLPYFTPDPWLLFKKDK